MNELKDKKGIAKVSKKGDKLQQTVENFDLKKDLENINIDSVIKKTAVSRSIWKVESFERFASDKSARRVLRTQQLNLSKAVIRNLKLKDKEAALKSMKDLKSFYVANLVDISNYSNVSENVNPDKFKIIHTAYQFMKVETM